MVTYIGCAGWSLGHQVGGQFPDEGSHLERYAQRFHAVEINSSFYRPHQTKTYAKWAAAVPAEFRFAVKIPKRMTHELRLRDVGETLDRFQGEVTGLGDKLGVLLVQLPPSLQFEQTVAFEFFQRLRDRFDSCVVCEPRHASWFAPLANDLLLDFRIARAAVDPAPVPAAASPAGWSGLVYYRLHGSPRIYYSAYAPDDINKLAGQLRCLAESAVEAWCIFDNTAAGAALENGLTLQTELLATKARSSIVSSQTSASGLFSES